MKFFNRNDLLKTLPYGESFLFINEANLYLDGSGGGYYIVPSPNVSEIVRDHFPGLPIFPGHLQMEAIAQLAALIYLVKYGSPGRSVLPVLTASYGELATFAQSGDRVDLYAEIRVKGKKVDVDGIVSVGVNTSHVLMEGVAIPMSILERMARRKEATLVG